MALSRKEFVRLSLGVAGAAAVGSLLSACSGDDGPSAIEETNSGQCLANGAHDSAISGNHGHSLTVPAADIQAGVQKNYDIEGNSDHPHTITLTSEHFALLAQNQAFNVTSTEDNVHTHVVTVSCV